MQRFIRNKCVGFCSIKLCPDAAPAAAAAAAAAAASATLSGAGAGAVAAAASAAANAAASLVLMLHLLLHLLLPLLLPPQRVRAIPKCDCAHVWASSCYTKYEANIHELQRLYCKTQYEVNNYPKHAHQTESTRITEFSRFENCFYN